jgi:hypothetical protein
MKYTLLLVTLLLPGCTNFTVKQADISPERTILNEIKGTAWFSSAQTISKLKATQTDKTQSFGTEGIGQQGATNTIEGLRLGVEFLKLLRPVP